MNLSVFEISVLKPKSAMVEVYPVGKQLDHVPYSGLFLDGTRNRFPGDKLAWERFQLWFNVNEELLMKQKNLIVITSLMFPDLESLVFSAWQEELRPSIEALAKQMLGERSKIATN